MQEAPLVGSYFRHPRRLLLSDMSGEKPLSTDAIKGIEVVVKHLESLDM